MSDDSTITSDRSRRFTRDRAEATLARTCAVGAMAGLLGGLAMNTYTRVVASATDGHEADGVAPGSRRIGRGMQPPQADGRAEDDAAVRLGSAAYRTATGDEPDKQRQIILGVLAHYGFSAAAGVGYALLVQRMPSLARGWGSFYGSMVWATADETAVPVLGLSRRPEEQSAGMHAYSLTGHWIYGITVATVHRLALR